MPNSAAASSAGGGLLLDPASFGLQQFATFAARLPLSRVAPTLGVGGVVAAATVAFEFAEDGRRVAAQGPRNVGLGAARSQPLGYKIPFASRKMMCHR